MFLATKFARLAPKQTFYQRFYFPAAQQAFYNFSTNTDDDKKVGGEDFKNSPFTESELNQIFRPTLAKKLAKEKVEKE